MNIPPAAGQKGLFFRGTISLDENMWRTWQRELVTIKSIHSTNGFDNQLDLILFDLSRLC